MWDQAIQAAQEALKLEPDSPGRKEQPGLGGASRQLAVAPPVSVKIDVPPSTIESAAPVQSGGASMRVALLGDSLRSESVLRVVNLDGVDSRSPDERAYTR